MKELAAFGLLIALIAAGWNHPFKEYFGDLLPAKNTPAETVALPPKASAVPSRTYAAPPPVAATPAPDTSWLWQRSTLDRKESAPKGGH